MTTTLSPAGDQPIVAARQLVASVAASHCGLVRAKNQDAFLENPRLGLWAIADGMGGLASGERASRAVVDALARLEPGTALADRVEVCMIQVNDDLRWEAAMSDGGSMMGSTVVVLLVEGQGFVCLWAGDSRLYRWRNGSLQRMTSDHTPRQALLNAGLVQPEHPMLQGLDHMVSRAVGIEDTFRFDRVEGVIEPGDLFLLCTDGLSKVIDEAVICTMLGSAIPAHAIQHLIQAALLAGGPDNVTAVIVGEHAPSSGGEPGATDRYGDQDTAIQLSSPPAPPRAAGERVVWLGISCALLVGLLSIGLQNTELHLQIVATNPAIIRQVRTGLLGVEGRATVAVIAVCLLLTAAVLGRVGRRPPLLAYVGAVALLVATGVAIISATDLGNPFIIIITAHLRLPALPLPASRFIDFMN